MMKVPCFCGHVMGIPIEKHTLAFTFCFHLVNFRDCWVRGNPIASTIDCISKTSRFCFWMILPKSILPNWYYTDWFRMILEYNLFHFSDFSTTNQHQLQSHRHDRHLFSHNVNKQSSYSGQISRIPLNLDKSDLGRNPQVPLGVKSAEVAIICRLCFRTRSNVAILCPFTGDAEPHCQANKEVQLQLAWQCMVNITRKQPTSSLNGCVIRSLIAQ